MSFTVLVPARLASTRLPGKPLADIGGLPMVVRVAQRAALSGAARVVVAADAQPATARVWVATLDFELAPASASRLLSLLPPRR